jgi:hypothetical protein
MCRDGQGALGAGVSRNMRRYMAGEIRAVDYVRLTQRDASRTVRREQADRRSEEPPSRRESGGDR